VAVAIGLSAERSHSRPTSQFKQQLPYCQVIRHFLVVRGCGTRLRGHPMDRVRARRQWREKQIIARIHAWTEEQPRDYLFADSKDVIGGQLYVKQGRLLIYCNGFLTGTPLISADIDTSVHATWVRMKSSVLVSGGSFKKAP
jgi:hypothetical protein